MDKLERNFEHGKDKIAGGAKEAAGKVTGNESLELKGKMQSAKADVKKKMSSSGENVKENIAGSINNKLDRKERNDKKRN